MKKVLFICPQWMGLSKDIKEGLKNLNYDVTEIVYRANRFDPLNVRADFKLPEAWFSVRNKRYWSNILSQKPYIIVFDLLFVVDGEQLHPILFNTLRQRNPSIRCVNYLYDTIKGVYKYNVISSFFDDVYSFDREECQKYNMHLLPIYWVPTNNKVQLDYSVFGFGTYSEHRFKTFSIVSKILDQYHVPYNIQLYHSKIKNIGLFKIKLFLRKLIGKPAAINMQKYNDPLISHSFLKTKEFNDIVSSVDVVLDTAPLHQDGLTARFMWALGAGRKIITTNKNALFYEFYNPSQIFYLNIDNLDPKKMIDFVKSDVLLSDNQKKMILEYRIDNWLNTIIER